MRSILVVLLSMCICAPALAAKKKKKSKKNKPQTEIKSVTMGRTPCYGRCPEYNINVSADGVVTYTGKRFAKDSGVYYKNIGADKAVALIKEVETYKPDTCSENYPNRIPDVPGMYFEISYKDKLKKIKNANFGPAYFKYLATLIDNVGLEHDATWKKK